MENDQTLQNVNLLVLASNLIFLKCTRLLRFFCPPCIIYDNLYIKESFVVNWMWKPCILIIYFTHYISTFKTLKKQSINKWYDPSSYSNYKGCYIIHCRCVGGNKVQILFHQVGYLAKIMMVMKCFKSRGNYLSNTMYILLTQLSISFTKSWNPRMVLQISHEHFTRHWKSRARMITDHRKNVW